MHAEVASRPYTIWLGRSPGTDIGNERKPVCRAHTQCEETTTVAHKQMTTTQSIHSSSDDQQEQFDGMNEQGGKCFGALVTERLFGGTWFQF